VDKLIFTSEDKFQNAFGIVFTTLLKAKEYLDLENYSKKGVIRLSIFRFESKEQKRDREMQKLADFIA